MNQSHTDYALYNIWANNKIIECLLIHNEAILDKEVVSSFSTIRSTILHIWKAEMGWLSRLLGKDWDATRVKNFKGTAPEMFAAWQSTSVDFKNFVQENDLDQTILWGHTNEQIAIARREVAQTVFNHGSYHRGQIVVMMRQLGINKIPTTDYIAWRWETAKL
jgi:uncharacterized damage-inducible protein DinB